MPHGSCQLCTNSRGLDTRPAHLSQPSIEQYLQHPDNSRGIIEIVKMWYEP